MTSFAGHSDLRWAGIAPQQKQLCLLVPPCTLAFGVLPLYGSSANFPPFQSFIWTFCNYAIILILVGYLAVNAVIAILRICVINLWQQCPKINEWQSE